MADKQPAKQDTDGRKYIYARGVPKLGFYRAGVFWPPAQPDESGRLVGGAVHRLTDAEIDELKAERKVADVRPATESEIAGIFDSASEKKSLDAKAELARSRQLEKEQAAANKKARAEARADVTAKG